MDTFPERPVTCFFFGGGIFAVVRESGDEGRNCMGDKGKRGRMSGGIMPRSRGVNNSLRESKESSLERLVR